MNLKLKTELYRSFKELDLQKLTEQDNEDLLKIFNVVDNVLIRDQIAFIFADLKYEKAVSSIIRRIKEKDAIHNNGSLVYALQSFEMDAYFIDLIDIICDMEYEARLMAYELIETMQSHIDDDAKKNGLKKLQHCRSVQDHNSNDTGENSTIHFIEATIKLLSN